MTSKNDVVLAMIDYVTEELNECKNSLLLNGDLKQGWIDKIVKCYTIVSNE